MFRRFACLSVAAFAILYGLAAPGQVHAQRMRGGSSRDARMGMTMNRGFNSRSGFMPAFNVNPRFQGMPMMPFGNRGTFDSFEDRFENRFRFERFDRFEDRFENRMFLGGFNQRLNSTFFDPRLGACSSFRPL
jgi:hypothetical protein